MAVSVNRIHYNGYSSLDFDVVMDLSFDGDTGAVGSYLNRSAVASDTYNGNFKNVYRYKYDEVLAPTFTFIKRTFTEFHPMEVRRILKWLTSRDTPSFCTVQPTDSGMISYELLGAFTQIETYKNTTGQVIGIVAVFECTSPWAWSTVKHYARRFENILTDSLEVDIHTDDVQHCVFPKLYIENGAGANLTLSNKHDDGKGNDVVTATTLKNNINNEKITMDCANKVITSNRIGGRLFADDFVDWKWFGLYNGKNVITASTPCIITLDYRECIKCGSL